MSAAKKLEPAELVTPPIPEPPDLSKPLPLKWWRVRTGDFNNMIADGYLGLGKAVNDGVDTQGVIEALWLMPNGVCMAAVRTALPAGAVKFMIFKDGHGAPL